jgi:hypothetical protein
MSDDARHVTRHLSRYPIEPDGNIFRLKDARGRQISWHRTQSGALRARRTKIEEDAEQ